MAKKFSKQFLLLSCVVFSNTVFGNICSYWGNIDILVPSMGVAGLKLDVPLTGCTCFDDVIWIDTNLDSGKAIYSAALAAKLSGIRVLATIQDGQGQGAPGNTSIAYRWWASCKLEALQLQ